MSADRMADCTQKLQATISAAVESWQTGFNSFTYRSARSIFSWADGCSTRCHLFNLVPRCQVSRCPPLRYGAALSSLAMSVPTILMVSRCQVSRFQSPRTTFNCVVGQL